METKKKSKIKKVVLIVLLVPMILLAFMMLIDYASEPYEENESASNSLSDTTGGSKETSDKTAEQEETEEYQWKTISDFTDDQRAEAERNFRQRYRDSEACVYLGKGQIVEVYRMSYGKFAYDYANSTDYQKELINPEADGRWMCIMGEVTGVSAYGEIYVTVSTDFEHDASNAILWEGESYAHVQLNGMQFDELAALSEGDEIIIFGEILMDSYDTFLGLSTFDCYSGILYSVNDRLCDIPVLDFTMDIYQLNPDYSGL